ncbi:hypothetical protein HOG48_05390 [Candidatus Peregrinibacteria bacterium]|jgi:hypothetical protein|nr:hypothetical protein [Candidatus Peregrinibacteria bacterium]
MRKLLILFILLTLGIALQGCETTIEEPTNSLKNQVTGSAFAITISLEGRVQNPIEAREESLTNEMKAQIEATFDTKTHRYLSIIEPKEGVMWVDYKKSKANFFTAPFEDGFTHIESAIASPTGRYIALNLTRGAHNAWSRLIIIDTKTNTYAKPLDDNTLLTPSEESFCTEIEIVKARTEANKMSECVAEAPKTVYLLDYWSDSHTIELIKQFPSSTIIYSVDVK